MTEKQREIRNTARLIVQYGKEVDSALDMYNDQLLGKGEYDSMEEAERELRAAVSDLKCFIRDFDSALLK